MFSVEQALSICTANLNKRAEKNRTSYTLYFTNEQTRYEGKLVGSTIKALVDEFRTSKGAYKYAFIVKTGQDNKILRFYNRDISKKFFSMTRTGKKNK